MTKTQSEDLFDEIVANSRADRERLVEVAEGIRKLNKTKDELGGFSEDPVDPEISSMLSEEMCRITDSLTKINQQLVELVKSEQKSKKSGDEAPRLSDKEKSRMYEEMEKHRKVNT